MANSRRAKRKKASIKRIVISLILVLAVAFGIYALVTNDKSANEDNQNIHDVQTAEKDQSSSKEEKEKPSEAGKVSVEDIEDKGNDEEGASSTVTDTDKVTGPTTTESSKETTNEDETEIRMPVDNKDTILTNAKPQVYTIYATGEQGSGFLFNTKGDIITNAHVVEYVNLDDSSADVVVVNSTGQELNGRVIGRDDTTDVALIRVPDLAGKNPMVIDTAQAVVGTPVVAIGSPHKLAGTTTEGKITSVGANFTDGYSYRNLYEITARLEPGSSGGPLINMNTGNVIGINSIILTEHPEIGYSIPMANVMDLVNKWATYDEEIVFGGHDEEDEMTPEMTIADDEANNFAMLKGYLGDLYYFIEEEFKFNGQRTYLNLMQPDSPAVNKAIQIYDNYVTTDKSNQSIEYDIVGTPRVEGDTVNVDVKSTLTYTKDGKEQQLVQNLTYQYVFEFDIYYVKDITLNSSTDTADEVISPQGTETPSTPEDTEETEDDDSITPQGIETPAEDDTTDSDESVEEENDDTSSTDDKTTEEVETDAAQ
ncbi:S1C family serine protease [Kurthia massiliensis]|uniref:S1C family serine protease n=1 Tax=Kurthia massiliensis TaxID=1033739 RepID=UPI000289B006|nr:trypsin-like peptidase domain-containing protein [Kurthia massiliensis]